MAATVFSVYRSLSVEQQNKTITFGRNNGEAGALEYYRDKYDLPVVISSHDNYWLWGYGDEAAEIYIILGGDENDYDEFFGQVEQVIVIKCDYWMPYENNLPVYVCRDKKASIDEIWDRRKH